VYCASKRRTSAALDPGLRSWALVSFLPQFLRVFERCGPRIGRSNPPPNPAEPGRPPAFPQACRGIGPLRAVLLACSQMRPVPSAKYFGGVLGLIHSRAALRSTAPAPWWIHGGAIVIHLRPGDHQRGRRTGGSDGRSNSPGCRWIEGGRGGETGNLWPTVERLCGARRGRTSGCRGEGLLAGGLALGSGAFGGRALLGA